MDPHWYIFVQAVLHSFASGLWDSRKSSQLRRMKQRKLFCLVLGLGQPEKHSLRYQVTANSRALLEQQKSFWISSRGFLWILMQVSHLRNRSCYLRCSSPPGTSLTSSVVCSFHLIFFKPRAGSAYLYCIHSPYVPSSPLKSPHYYLHLQYWDIRSEKPACMPTSGSDKHAADLLTVPLLNPPASPKPFWQLITIFLPLSYV